MKNPKANFGDKTRPKKKKARLINLNHADLLNAELEYEKYFDRIKLLSRGL